METTVSFSLAECAYIWSRDDELIGAHSPRRYMVCGHRPTMWSSSCPLFPLSLPFILFHFVIHLMHSCVCSREWGDYFLPKDTVPISSVSALFSRDMAAIPWKLTALTRFVHFECGIVSRRVPLARLSSCLRGSPVGLAEGPCPPDRPS